MTAMIPKDETIRVPSLGGREDREVSRQILGRIVEPRMEEILNLAYNEVVRFGFEDLLAAGVVLTGGTSLLDGISELAEQIFDMPARKGIPIGVGGLIRYCEFAGACYRRRFDHLWQQSVRQ